MRCGCFGASRTRKKERKPSDYISGEIEGKILAFTLFFFIVMYLRPLTIL